MPFYDFANGAAVPTSDFTVIENGNGTVTAAGGKCEKNIR